MLLGGRSSPERTEGRARQCEQLSGARSCELKEELVNVVRWQELVRAN